MPNKNYNRKTSDEKKKEIMDISEKALSQIEKYSTSPESLIEYADFLARFHAYSTNNTSLIQQQFPGAVAVASFKDWKDNGYSVNKGETGSKILSFTPVTLFKNAEGETKQLSSANAAEKKQVNDKTLTSWKVKNFKIGHVFDVSQTNAPIEDLPKIFPNKQFDFQIEDGKNGTHLKKGIDAVAKELNIEIKDMKDSSFGLNELGSAKGVFAQGIDLTKKEILLNSRNTETQNIATSIHELAHAKLHDRTLNNEFDTPTKEFQAELTSYIVCKHYGMDTSEKAIPYIANWTKNGAKLEDKQKAIEGVHIASSEFIDIIDNVISNEQNIEIEGEKSGMNYYGELLMIQESYSLLPNKLDLEDTEFWRKVEAVDPESYNKYLTYGSLYQHEEKYGKAHFEEPVMFIHGVSNDFKSFGEMNEYDLTPYKYVDISYTVAIPEAGELKSFSGKYDKGEYVNPLHHIKNNDLTDKETLSKLEDHWHDFLIKEESKNINQWHRGQVFEQTADLEPVKEEESIYPIDQEETLRCILTGKAIAQDEGYYQIEDCTLSEEAHKLTFSEKEWENLYAEGGDIYWTTCYYDLDKSEMTPKEPEPLVDQTTKYYHYDGQSEPVKLGTLSEVVSSEKKQDEVGHFSINRELLLDLAISKNLEKEYFGVRMEKHGVLKNPGLKDFEEVNERLGLDKKLNLNNLILEPETDKIKKAHALLSRSMER